MLPAQVQLQYYGERCHPADSEITVDVNDISCLRTANQSLIDLFQMYKLIDSAVAMVKGSSFFENVLTQRKLRFSPLNK